MSGKKIAIFGEKEAFNQPHVKELRESLNALKHEVVLLPAPKVLQSFTKWKELIFDWMIFIGSAKKDVPDFTPWSEVFSQLEHQPLFASWTLEKIPQPFRIALKPDFEFLDPNNKSEILQSLGLKGATEIKSEHFLSDVDLNLVELSQKVSEEAETGLHTAAFLDEPSSLSMMPIDSSGGFEVEHAGEEPLLSSDSNDEVGIDLSADVEEEPSLESFSKPAAKKSEVSKYNSLDDLFEGDDLREADSLASELEEDSKEPMLSMSEANEGSFFADQVEDQQDDEINLSSDFFSDEDGLPAQELTQQEDVGFLSDETPNDDSSSVSLWGSDAASGSPLDEEQELFQKDNLLDDSGASFLDAVNKEIEKESGQQFMSGRGNTGDQDSHEVKNTKQKEEISNQIHLNALDQDKSSLEISNVAKSDEDLELALGHEASVHSSNTVVGNAGTSVNQAKTKVSNSKTMHKKISSKVVDEAAALFEGENAIDLSEGTHGESEDLKTIKRYALLKEREAREKASALKALKSEFEKCRHKLEVSESERRKSSLKVEELDLQLRTALDKNEEHRHQFTKMEQSFQEQLKDLKIRLESAQFQASKSERKLEDFRDRVRNDIQKIRVRERELANRLDLQKRDAEALLGTKDERLLQQKREIDRLQFEVDTLRERLEEEVERSEERSKKLSRAMQSLKLAQGMLSGLEDSDFDDLQGGDSEGEAA